MKRAGVFLALGLVAAVVAAALPSPAAAGQREHHRERRGSDHSRHARPVHGHGHGHRHHHPVRPFVTFYSPPSVVYYTYYTPPPVYYVPPVVYQPPPVYAPPAVYSPPPVMQRVIEYQTGRYELHGDGQATAYEWVWIPNPPSAPPAQPAVAAPPTAPAAASASRDAFRWTDDNGVTTWTDRLDTIPERYRAQVQRFR